MLKHHVDTELAASKGHGCSMMLQLATTRMRTLSLAPEAISWAEEVPTVKVCECMAVACLFQRIEAGTVRMVATGIEADSPVRRATSPVMHGDAKALARLF